MWKERGTAKLKACLSGHSLSVSAQARSFLLQLWLGLAGGSPDGCLADLLREFTASGFTGTVEDGRLGFWFAPYAQAGDEYYIDDVTLTRINGGSASALVPSAHQRKRKCRKEFALFQNYPNPFNPTTRIKYTVGGIRAQGPGVSDVKITVYDLLGREVAVLVNEKKAPGLYEVPFDGGRLASGMYIYRLSAGLPAGQAGSFVESRPMILLK